MKLVTAQEMQKLDQWAIQELGIPQIALMENAGKAVADQVSLLTKRPKVVVVAYKGNNAGDGFVAARHLLNQGYEPSIFLLCKKEEISGSAKTNLAILEKLDVPVYSINLKTLEKLLRSSDAVIDAIFGIGLSKEISSPLAEAIDLINHWQKKRRYLVIAVDIPSGVNATTGQVDQHTIEADLTVTFALPKKGLLKDPAVKKVGKLIVADIGIPDICLKDLPANQAGSKTQRSEKKEFYLPKRLAVSNKGDYGRVLIVAGSRNMSGAAALTARAALRSGAGLVYLAVPYSIQKIVAPKTREVITIGLPETAEGSINLEAFTKINQIKADVIAIGPGLTTAEETKELVKRLLLKTKAQNIVLDADGLNCLVGDPLIMRRAKAKTVITPHPGEMARLLGKTVKYIQQHRTKVAQTAAIKWQVAVVLKGAYTITVEDGKLWLNSSGNPGMASAGVGDVLTGMVAAFIAQGLTVKEAVYCHGLAGDLAAVEKGEIGLIASDVIEQIPYALRKVS